MDIEARIEDRIRGFSLLKGNTAILKAAGLITAGLKAGRKILVFGNGGSATQASHFAAELVNKFYFPRPGLPALALGADMANLTAIANDSDFRYIFSRQIQAFGTGGDIALGITTSGKSANVLEGLKVAREMGLITIALCGPDTGALDELCLETIIRVDSHDTPLIQEMHLFILHILAETLESRLFPSPGPGRR